MKRRAWLVQGLAAVFALAGADAPATTTQAELTPAADFRADATGANERPRLVVVLFSLPDCPYCAAIRREQLAPLARDPKWQGRLVVREVSIVGAHPLVAFDGSRTTEAVFAGGAAVRFSPTVSFFDPQGAQLVPPIVGARLPDFYGAYLDEAIETSLSRIGGGP